MTQSQLDAWSREEQTPFSGWDFSHLTGRMIEEALPWDYLARARQLMRQAASVLDMETGGGEKLLSMRDDWPARVEATEGYGPNVQLARTRLAPLGVAVHEMDAGNELPMALGSGSYELVLNRHGAFNPCEISRILRPGGRFLTQQVHGRWAEDLLAEFGAKPQWPNAVPEYYVPRLQAAGLEVVDVRTFDGKLTFTDVGAAVYCLKATPWLVPGFSAKTYLAALMRLQARLEADGQLDFRAGYYFIEVRTPERP